MKAARFHGTEDGLKIEDVEVPEPDAGEVLVEVAGSGVCHSDLHILDGDLPLPNTPITLGHENAGYVDSTGAGVEVDEGTPVAVYGPWGCGSCEVCLRGEDQLCDFLEWVSVGYDGGYAEYLLVPNERYVLPLDGLDPVEAAPLTDAALTAYRSVGKVRDATTPAADVMVVGVGGLGGFAVQFARRATSGDVVTVDLEPEKLERAERLGADVTVDASAERVGSRVDEVDAVVDLVGSDESLRTATNVLDRRGVLVLAGIGGGSVPFSWNPLQPAEMQMETVHWGSVPELQEVLEFAGEGKLEVDYETVGFDDLHETFRRLEEGEVDGRAVLTP